MDRLPVYHRAIFMIYPTFLTPEPYTLELILLYIQLPEMNWESFSNCPDITWTWTACSYTPRVLHEKSRPVTSIFTAYIEVSRSMKAFLTLQSSQSFYFHAFILAPQAAGCFERQAVKSKLNYYSIEQPVSDSLSRMLSERRANKHFWTKNGKGKFTLSAASMKAKVGF